MKEPSDKVIIIMTFIVWKNIIQFCGMIVDCGSGECILKGCNFAMLKSAKQHKARNYIL